METWAHATSFESRWPIVLAIAAVLLIHVLMPGRVAIVPPWTPYVLGSLVLAPVLLVGLTRGSMKWIRIERVSTFVFVGLAAIGTIGKVWDLLFAILYRSKQVTGVQLLASSVEVWVVNILMFSLLYWQMDRGGPQAREMGGHIRPDWVFPQQGELAENVPPGWKPTFVDFLFLGYTTATAFSTTDVVPLTSRAKLMMMAESTISLATIVVVAARAINVLSS